MSNRHGQQQNTYVRANWDEQSGRQGRSEHRLEQDAPMAVDAGIVSRVRSAFERVKHMSLTRQTTRIFENTAQKYSIYNLRKGFRKL